MQDIRWIQRFNNYKKALKTLQSDIELFKTRELSARLESTYSV